MVVKTYRGLLASGAQERIKLQTSAGKVGYRIVKFQIMPDDPFTETVKLVVKIFKSTQSTIDDTVNFTDSDLLGVATSMETADLDQAGYGVIIFDREVFNQDIFITNFEATAAESANYYLELEVIPLASDEAAITTVKAMRGSAVD